MSEIDYAKWLSDGLNKPGKNAMGLANALEVHRSAIYKMISGERKINANELPIIAKYLEDLVPTGSVPAIIADAKEREVFAIAVKVIELLNPLTDEQRLRVIRAVRDLAGDVEAGGEAKVARNS